MAQRILVVEDSPTQAERVRLLLEEAGYQVDLAANGREGLERIQALRPDLIISDIVMPEMDGYAFCQAVKSAERTRRIPVVLLTAQNRPADIIIGLERGADNFITKPFDDDYLLERVQRIFEHLELRTKGSLEMEVVLSVAGRQLTINADKQQVIELLFSTFDELSRLNDRLEDYVQNLEAKVQERTQQLKQYQETLHGLYQASLQIQEALGLRDRLDRLLHAAREVLELDRLNLLLADSKSQWLQAVASLGTEEPLEEIRVPIGPVGGGLAQAYLSRQAVVWEGRGPVPENLRLKPPYDQVAALRSQAFVILPLTIQGRAIGVIAVDRKNSRRPLEADALELLQLFAAQAALTVEHGQLYEAQRMAAIQLEARVEDRTRDLQEAMLLLEAGSKHKSEFLANMSHELRTPLNSILGFSDLLRDQKVGPLTEKQARYVYNIRESGRHLLTLINDLLDLSKVEAGKLELRPEVFNLREAIETALTGIRPQSLAKALELTLQVDEALSLLTADPVRFKQILLNLLSNAIKFTPKGGSITVTARPVHSPERTGPGTADPGREPAGEFVEIAVADTGVGIRPEDLPKLFQPFTQLEGSFTKQYHGTGLGLALTKRLVESHGGTVRAESEGEGRGSIFTVRLPLTSQA